MNGQSSSVTKNFMQQSLVSDVQAACSLKMSLTRALLQQAHALCCLRYHLLLRWSFHDRRSMHSKLTTNHRNMPLPRSLRKTMQ